jgi:hypothetical protein
MKNLGFKNLNQKGQSAIEFIMVVVVVFFFLLFYLSFSITLVASEYVDYATFMAARTYRSGNIDKEFQKAAAKKVFEQYMAPVSSIIHSPKFDVTNAATANRLEGVTTGYEVDLFYLPPLFVRNGKAPVSRLPLQSETLLGRDPNLKECLDFFENFANTHNLNVGGTSFINFMEDNGC